MTSIDDELGETCTICGIELNDQNRAGTNQEPMCRMHYMNIGFLMEFMVGGGTPEVMKKMLERAPNWVLRDMRGEPAKR